MPPTDRIPVSAEASDGSFLPRLKRRLRRAQAPVLTLSTPYVPDDPARPLALNRLAPLTQEDVDPSRTWPRARRAAAEQLWGESCTAPGGVEFTVELSRPLNPAPGVALLEMTSGLGGGTRAIANTFGIYVTGIDGDADLAIDGQLRSTSLGMERRASIRAIDLDGFELKPGAFDAALAREAFYMVADKARLFASIARGLRPGGQLVFTDLVASGKRQMGPPMQRWMAAERSVPHPIMPQQMVEQLQRFFVVKAADDITPIYRSMILSGLMHFAGQLKGKRVPRQLLEWTSREVEFWARRVALFERKELAVYRFHVERKTD